MHRDTLRNWVRQAEVDGGIRAGTSTDDARWLAELERENRELSVVCMVSYRLFTAEDTRAMDLCSRGPEALDTDHIHNGQARSPLA